MITLKQRLDEVLGKWKEDGNRTTFYTCSHCKKKIETARPGKSLVTSKGYWDSVKVCPLCGEYSFVLVYPSGKTKVNKLGL